MKRPKLKGCDMDTLERIVRDNAKQRFTMRPEPTGPNGEDELWIRANQGHSVAVSSPPDSASPTLPSPRLTTLVPQVESLELTPVTKAEDVPVMVHGTTTAIWPTIGKSVARASAYTHLAAPLVRPPFADRFPHDACHVSRSQGRAQGNGPEPHPLRSRPVRRGGRSKRYVAPHASRLRPPPHWLPS
jgi:hypothetical protein